MAPKWPPMATSAAFDDDDVSLMEMLAFVKPVPKKSAPRDDVSKKRKRTSSQVEKAKGNNQDGCEKEAALAKSSDGRGPSQVRVAFTARKFG